MLGKKVLESPCKSWIFRWILSCLLFQGRWPEEIHEQIHQKNPPRKPNTKIHEHFPLAKGFCKSEVLGEVSVLEGGSSGRSFSRSLPRSFSRSFRPCFAETFRAKKNFSENFSPKFPWPCTAKTGEISGKNFTTRFCRGPIAKFSRERMSLTSDGLSQGARTLGKGVFLPPSKHLPSAVYQPPSKNPSENPCPYWNIYMAPSDRTFLRSSSLQEPSKNPSKSRVLLHDPLFILSTLLGAAPRGNVLRR